MTVFQQVHLGSFNKFSSVKVLPTLQSAELGVQVMEGRGGAEEMTAVCDAKASPSPRVPLTPDL